MFHLRDYFFLVFDEKLNFQDTLVTNEDIFRKLDAKCTIVVIPLNKTEEPESKIKSSENNLSKEEKPIFCQIQKQTLNNVSISEELIQQIDWKTKKIFDLDTAFSIEEVLIEWKSHGFVILRLNSTFLQALNELYIECQNFFALSEEEKLKYRYSLERYLGYSYRKDLLKEFFQVRHTTQEIEKLIWHSKLPQFYNLSFQCFKEFKYLTQTLFSLIMKSLGASEDYIQSFFEKDVLESSEEIISQCVLEVFHYFGKKSSLCTNPKTIPCPFHSDIGMITCIPRSIDGTGLMLFDWNEGMWMDVEVNAPENVAFVFGGETLARITNNLIPPTVHQVALRDIRHSFPFLMLGKANAVIDCGKLNPDKIGPLVFSDTIKAKEYVYQVSSSRISSLFKYNIPSLET